MPKEIMQFVKFIILGFAKATFNSIIYISLLKIGANIYWSFTLAALVILIWSYFINRKYIFKVTDSGHFKIFIKYLFIFISYLPISYLFIYFLEYTNISKNLYSLIISIILVYPNYYATKYIFK